MKGTTRVFLNSIKAAIQKAEIPGGPEGQEFVDLMQAVIEFAAERAAMQIEKSGTVSVKPTVSRFGSD